MLAELKTILIVDDDDSFRDAINKLLEREGYQVLQASSGRAAIEVLCNSPVDLVLLDIYMEEMGGIEFLERTCDASRPPVVVLTAFSNEAIRQDSASRGAAAFLVKPVKRRELTRVIRDVLSRPGSNG